MMNRTLISTVILIFSLFFGACSLPDTDNLPQKDWTIERILYYKNFSSPYFEVYFGGENSFDDYNYYYKKDKRTPIRFSDIILIPGVPCTGWGFSFPNGFSAHAATGGTPTGDAVVTYNKYFYELTGGDKYFDAEWSAEIRIVTKTVPVTVIE